MTITQGNQRIRINKDGTLDRRYKAGAKIQKKDDYIARKYQIINNKINNKKKKISTFRIIKALIWLCLLTSIFYFVTLAETKDVNETIFTPVETINTTTEVSLDTQDNLTGTEKDICNMKYSWDCSTAVAIAKCESSLRSNAWVIEPNNTISVGLFQINSVHFNNYGGIQNVLNNNIDVAYSIYQDWGNNFNAWTCNNLIGNNK